MIFMVEKSFTQKLAGTVGKYYLVGENEVALDTSENQRQYTTWAKIGEFTVPREIFRSNFTVKFKLKYQKSEGSIPEDCAQGKIYINGVATGTTQSWDTNTWEEFSEDFNDIEPLDTIELWIRSTEEGYNCYAKDFGIYGELVKIKSYEEPDWS